MGDLTKHLDWSEFECQCRQCGPMPGPVKRNTERLAHHLEMSIRAVGPLKVHSGYRCPAHNAAVGGEAQSRHMVGDAADISVYDEKTKEWWPGERIRGFIEAEMKAGRFPLGGLGTYVSKPFMCHVDLRGKPARWRYP